jgi:hypothetical protein
MIKNPSFLPRLEWAGRTGLSVLFMCLLAYLTGDNILLLPGFGAFVSVMTVEATLGKTTLNVVWPRCASRC